MAHPLRRAGGVFEIFHQELMGAPIDFSGLDLKAFDPQLLQEARETWHHRVHTEFRSTQIMTRFLTEVLGSGDPVDIYAGALDLVGDEIRHTMLCWQVCEALGVEAEFPSPLRTQDPQEYLDSPMPERALHTAISMVAINETLSVGFIEDLARRCDTPGISDVLQATLGDEEAHQDFGWSYIEGSLSRFPEETLDDWRHLVQLTLKPHFQAATEALEGVPKDRRSLDQWPEPERVALGLFSPPRQALIFYQTYEELLAPHLRKARLLLD